MHTPVNPPEAAHLIKESKSSLFSYPGSQETACKSSHPVETHKPFTSISLTLLFV